MSNAIAALLTLLSTFLGGSDQAPPPPPAPVVVEAKKPVATRNYSTPERPKSPITTPTTKPAPVVKVLVVDADGFCFSTGQAEADAAGLTPVRSCPVDPGRVISTRDERGFCVTTGYSYGKQLGWVDDPTCREGE